jgi:spore germination protein YaaH
VSNGFDPDRTSVFLASTRIRESIIDELLASLLSYGMDGVNIDFENVYLDDRDLVTQFVREMTPLFREAGLVVSIDVTILSGSEMWSMFYDREALGEIVDYMAVMTYDQHWGSSPVAGSVAQYQWVENGLKGVLEQVPAEKILLGLPFYTRVWEEREVDGSVRVSSRAISMGQLSQIINTRQLEPEWDEESGQYYTEYTEAESRFRIWIEDARSIDLKSSLVHRYDLAGAASWRRGFESADIWDVLEHNLKEMNDYATWAHARGLKDLYF